MISPQAFVERLNALAERPAFVFENTNVPDWFSCAAVLVLFWLDDNKIFVALTRRSQTVSTFKGQISFPGGHLDKGESWQLAALREAEEEIGLVQQNIQVLGRLDDAWSGLGHHVVPIVAWSNVTPSFTANTAEVSEILTVDVNELTRKGARTKTTKSYKGEKYSQLEVNWQQGSVAGLTADLLLEAIDWGLGLSPQRGIARQQELIRAAPILTKGEIEE